MKKLLFGTAVIMLLALVYSCSHEQKSDKEKYGLVGKVKSVTTVSYEAFDKFGEGTIQKAKPNNISINVVSYDSLGNMISDKSFSVYDVKRKYTTVINNKHQEIKWICYDDDDDSKMKYGTNYYYDDKGNILKELDIHNNSVTTYKNTYDSEGHLISQIGGSYRRVWDYSNGELIKFTEKFWDMTTELLYKNGQLYKEIHKDGSSPGYYRTPTYDEKGREIEAIVIENDNIDRKIKTVYLSTADTAPIEKIVWNADGAVEHDFTYSYFTDGKDTVTIFNFDKEVLEEIVFYLKETNGITRDTYHLKSSLLMGYQYIYEDGVLAARRDLENGTEHKYVDGILTITEENDDELTEKKFKSNNLISHITKEKSGKIKYSYVIDGDDSKKVVTIIDNGETKKGEQIFENGKIVKFTEANNGLTSTVSYNDKGYVSEVKSSDGTVLTYKYEFDAIGNWVKSVEYKNGKPNKITERSIIYY